MRRRETYNFAAEEEQKINASELDSAVATANLISIMDPKEIDDEEVKLISEATGASKEFVDEMADLCNDACEACDAGHKPEEVKQHFSAAAEDLINNYVTSCNFSASDEMIPGSPEEEVLQIAQLTTLVDDELLKEKPEEVAEVIAEATGTGEEVVKDIVETAKEHFSKGNTFVIEEDDLVNFAAGHVKKGLEAGVKVFKAASKKGAEAAAKVEKEATKNIIAGSKDAAAFEEKLSMKLSKQAAKKDLTKKQITQASKEHAKFMDPKGWTLTGKEKKQVKLLAKEAGEKAEKAALDEGLGKLGYVSKEAAAGELAAAKKKGNYLLAGGAAAAGVGGYAAGKNFSEETEEVVTETIVPEPTTIAQEGIAKEGVSDTQPVEATAQDPVKAAEIEPKEGGKVQDTTNAEAALKVQNDLATVETAADVTPAETNFGRQNLTGKEVTAGLKSLLGARYIPNK